MSKFAQLSEAAKKAQKSNEFYIWSAVTFLSMMLASGLFFGIWHWSYAAGKNIVEIMTYTSAPIMAWSLRDAPSLWLRRVGSAILLAWTIGLAYVVLITADRLWFVNGGSYPAWLATEATVTPENARTLRGVGSLCGLDKGIGTIEEKDNGVFMRCGFEWRPGNTFLIRNYDEANRLWWDAHPQYRTKGEQQ